MAKIEVNGTEDYHNKWYKIWLWKHMLNTEDTDEECCNWDPKRLWYPKRIWFPYHPLIREAILEEKQPSGDDNYITLPAENMLLHSWVKMSVPSGMAVMYPNAVTKWETKHLQTPLVFSSTSDKHYSTERCLRRDAQACHISGACVVPIWWKTTKSRRCCPCSWITNEAAILWAGGVKSEVG